MTQAEFDAIPTLEITTDWMILGSAELDTEDVAHLDAEGLRYYLPALMLQLLADRDTTSMRGIGTLHALDQRDGHPQGFVELLTPLQRQAVARYVAALPSLIELDSENLRLLERSFDHVWSRYLESPG